MNNEHDLGRIDPAFEGFLLKDGKIILPNGYRLGPGYLHAIPIRMQLIATLQRQLETPKQLLLYPDTGHWPAKLLRGRY